MAILKRHRSLAGISTLVLGLFAGCAIFQSRVERSFAFAHASHIEEEGLACINCHSDAARAEEPGMPSPDSCSVCHDELDAEKPADRQTASLFDGEAFRAAHHGALGPERIFSHGRHAQVIQDCSVCHAELEKSNDVLAVAPTSMDVCTDCHASREVANECSTCHTDWRVDLAPKNHAHHWMRSHGRVVRMGSEATVDRCEMCHQESTCVQCHRSEPPESHDAHWQQRGHGIASTIDRQNCAVCHTPDSCAQCHRDALPRNHTANWGAPRDTHCLSCHTPLQNEGCVACHSNTMSHRLATPKPDDPVHLRGMNCRQCHGPGLGGGLPHVDNGDDCNACHR